ncbi:hypothetical protein O2313_05585 [Bacillus amyloliquefaciens]|uniref:hypothetical protein n=1 Tax=Bacillus amyloliquefaciens TaxID=1390 RepID=UPI0022AEAE3D|nr:hypothetical protein [Bacillus amyloliquefaciens]MCZ4246313.1 hypothetical protein [Bacillus amyloliquefaciens]MCZ4247005.1 hypothetical protein [Bacillus amyloliquefaciens]
MMHLTNDEIQKSKGLMLIITGAVALVEEEGMTPRQALEQLERVKNTVWSALQEIHAEKEDAE